MVDYEKVDKTVEELQKLHPDMPHYILWVLATDYYINEEKSKDTEDEAQELKKEALKAYERAKEEFKTTKYESIKIEA
jgi:hypothetical protein